MPARVNVDLLQRTDRNRSGTWVRKKLGKSPEKRKLGRHRKAGETIEKDQPTAAEQLEG